MTRPRGSRRAQLRGRTVRQRLGHMLRVDHVGARRAPRSISRPARRAPGRVPRGGSRSTAGEQLLGAPCASTGSRASMPARGDHTALHGRGSPRPAARRARPPRGRGSATTRSKRSMSAPQRACCGSDRSGGASSGTRPPDRRGRHTDTGSSSPTSWNRAGKIARPPTRARRRSSRPRAAGAAPRAPAAGTPAARRAAARRGAPGVASPGRGDAPPPTIAAVDAVWWGARNGGVGSAPRPASMPAIEWIRVTSSAASSRAAAGSRAGGARASSCRCPAGPRRAGCAPPAAAISSTRRARSWPRTSPRSGTSAPSTGSARARARADRARPGSTRPPRRGAGPAPARCRRARPRRPTRPRTRAVGSRCRRAPSAAASAPGDGAQPPVERELADRRVPGERARRQLPRGGEHRQRDRQVEARSLLAQVGRCEVDRDPAQRPLELGGRDAAADALLRLLAGAVGEPDDRERRHAALEVGLDLDAARIEADEGVGDGSREHRQPTVRNAIDDVGASVPTL